MVRHYDNWTVGMLESKIFKQVRDKHEITIPKQIREELGIKIGDILKFDIVDNNRVEFFKIDGSGENEGSSR